MGALSNYFTGGAAGLDVVSQGMQLGRNYLQGLMNQHFEEKARESNFKWNEKAAKEADKRQRAQYMDLYSPQAMLQQYKAAGLSPSMMFSGAGSIGGGAAQGNMSAGVSGISSYPSGGSPLQGAEMSVLLQDAEGRDIDNAMKEIAKNLQEIQATKLEWEYKLLMTYFYDDKGEKSSFGDYAKKAKSFEDFIKTIEKQDMVEELRQYIKTENGEQALRAIYKSRHELDNDIAVLSSSKMNAQVMEKISRLLYNSNYAEQNRDATLSNLKQISESADLTATQKEAMNNLIDKLGDGTFKDIMVVVLMILSNYQHAQIKLNTGGQSFVTNNTQNNW